MLLPLLIALAGAIVVAVALFRSFTDNSSFDSGGFIIPLLMFCVGAGALLVGVIWFFIVLIVRVGVH